MFVRTSVEFVSKYISATTYYKAFMFGPLLPWRVGIHSMTPNPRVHAPGGARGQHDTLKSPFLSFAMDHLLWIMLIPDQPLIREYSYLITGYHAVLASNP